jgi:hypothetical protein
MAFTVGSDDERKLKNLMMSNSIPYQVKVPEVLKWFPSQNRFTTEQVRTALKRVRDRAQAEVAAMLGTYG